MRKLLAVLALAGALGCGGGGGSVTTPASPFVGSWHLATTDGVAVPATVVRSGITYHITSRTLLITGTSALWSDNTTLTTSDGKTYDQSGSASYTLSISGQSMTAGRDAGSAGAALQIMTFVLQGDGTLRSTDLSGVDIYRKQ
jgi:hypothetical protein